MELETTYNSDERVSSNGSGNIAITDLINVDTILDRLASDDPMVRMEAKLDYVINVAAKTGEGMSSAMEHMQDSPLGRMLGRMLGVVDDSQV